LVANKVKGGVKLKFSAFLATILVLACLVLPIPALESNILTVCEKNLSIDLGPSFEITSSEVNTSSSGMITNDLIINDAAQAGSAFVFILTIYDEILTKLDPDALSELFFIAAVEAAKENGDTEIGKWTAVDNRGRNVSVITMKTANEDPEVLNGIYNITMWNLDRTTYAGLISSFDEYNTTQIIRTLTIS